MQYTHLGLYSDLVDEAKRQHGLFPAAQPGPESRERFRDLLGFSAGDEMPVDAATGQCWEKDGVQGSEVSWWVGYGPRTHAWLLRPAGASGPLPGILALHDHGGFKFYGKEKIAHGPGPARPVLEDFQRAYYGGRAWANELARRGYAVLVHDTFLWGSRKFPLESMQAAVRLGLRGEEEFRQSQGGMNEIDWYNFWAGQHEHVVAKYCNLLGSSMAGVVAREDRIALNYLRSLPGVIAEKTGCMGLSGGGNRAALLCGSSAHLRAAVIVGLMSTYEGLLDHNVASHTWMFFPHGLARAADWPDLAACRAPAPLLVQYDTEDELFTPQGMQAAHQKLAEIYQAANGGTPGGYTGQFYPGPHKFDREMQQAAFTWLDEQLK